MHDVLDHPRIDDEHVIDRYLAGRLPAEMEARFEEHLFGCGSCLAAVEAGEHLRRGLREVAAEAAAPPTSGLVAWWPRRPASRRPLLALAASLVLLVPLAMMWRAGDTTSTAPPTRLAEPLGGVPVIALGPVREAAAPTPIRVDRTMEMLLLSLELPAVTAATYRVTLVDGAGSEIWRGSGLEPNLYDALAVVVPADYLAPGIYRAMVDAEAPERDEAVQMTFRILDDSG
ncbi:MAG: zf-HC2 domain-containing protein [Acidobacteriota bacterium]